MRSVVKNIVQEKRFHGLDALRGIAMLLGIVLHAALPYIPDIDAFWPQDNQSSYLITAIFQFIHVWRMPLFFILAGFFTKLFIDRKSWEKWISNRVLRIGIPLLIFSPLMALTLPWIFKFGRTAELNFFYSMEGYPFHLWFLWHLLIFVFLSLIFKPINSLLENNMIFDRIGKQLFQVRIPVILIFLISILIIPTGGELITNPIATGLYFVLGYLLYKNTDLFEAMKKNWVVYLSVGLVAFALFFALEIFKYYEPFKNLPTSKEKEDAEAFVWILQQPIKVTSALFLSYSFIGLIEAKFGDYSFAKRFISDGAYWMYLIHLPIVTVITFWMFRFDINPMFKFIVAILLTSAICLGTYKYIVRPTLIGTLLNGKRS